MQSGSSSSGKLCAAIEVGADTSHLRAAVSSSERRFRLTLSGGQPKVSNRLSALNRRQSSTSPASIQRSACQAFFLCAAPPTREFYGDHTPGPRDSVLPSTRRYTEKQCHHGPVSGDGQGSARCRTFPEA